MQRGVRPLENNLNYRFMYNKLDIMLHFAAGGEVLLRRLQTKWPRLWLFIRPPDFGVNSAELGFRTRLLSGSLQKETKELERAEVESDQ